MAEIGSIIADIIKGTTQAQDAKEPSKKSKAKYNLDANVKKKIHGRVKTLMDKFPVYPQMDLELLKKNFVNG
jgi:glycine hydroxymethyltransferase